MPHTDSRLPNCRSPPILVRDSVAADIEQLLVESTETPVGTSQACVPPVKLKEIVSCRKSESLNAAERLNRAPSDETSSAIGANVASTRRSSSGSTTSCRRTLVNGPRAELVNEPLNSEKAGFSNAAK